MILTLQWIQKIIKIIFNMKESKFILQYPENSGYDKTEINFYKGNPDLSSVFFAEKSEQKRLFISDLTITRLESAEDFFNQFTNKKILNDKTGEYIAFHETDILLVLGAGESFKTMDSVLTIVRTALENNLDRNSLMIAVGGGVLTDMAGFAASIFKRGIDVEFVPTTLLSMVDAAVGGKTGCDFEGYKNMLGAFHPAKKLYVWPSFVLSLPHNEYISGLGEAIKTALLFNQETVKMFEENPDKVLARDLNLLEKIIEECVRAKASIVQEDFKEKGRRAFLNLGHTFGHALEAVAGLGKITHGEAVCWGMMRQAELADRLSICEKSYPVRVRNLLKAYGYDTKAFPSVLEDKACNKENIILELLKAMHKDKKNNSSGLVRCTIQEDVCKTQIKSFKDDELIPLFTD